MSNLYALVDEAPSAGIVCAFEVNARPTPKGRPRFGKGRTYTDAKTVAFEEHVGLVSRQAMKGRPPTSAPVRVVALFEQADKRRSDLDNCLKSLLDGMGPVLVNDSQVVEIRARLNRGASVDRISVLVEEVTA